MKLPKEIITSGFDATGIALAVWCCALPFVGLVLTPVIGVQSAIAVALVLLVALVAMCWRRCIATALHLYREERRKRYMVPISADIQRTLGDQEERK
jgi:hypothetical protein